jgi:hypothetical protein
LPDEAHHFAFAALMHVSRHIRLALIFFPQSKDAKISIAITVFACHLFAYTKDPVLHTTNTMSEYTSTQAGFQRAMEWALTGPPDETKQYVEATVLPAFYQISNGAKREYDAYVKGIEVWRSKVSDYKPKVLVQ